MARTTQPSDTRPSDTRPPDQEPRYWQVATQLLGELRDGTIPPGERLPGKSRICRRSAIS